MSDKRIPECLVILASSALVFWSFGSPLGAVAFCGFWLALLPADLLWRRWRGSASARLTNQVEEP